VKNASAICGVKTKPDGKEHFRSILATVRWLPSLSGENLKCSLAALTDNIDDSAPEKITYF